jgi:hypothetical protein
MFRADDFRQYAQECIVSARVSKSDAIREHFLDMAKTWTIAAAQIDKEQLPRFTHHPLDQMRH